MRRLAESLRGKTVLLTGGTGFLGKIIVERLLRCAPDIERIYLLIRPRRDPDGVATGAEMRFETEVLPSGAFDSLARSLGERWPAFAREKLMPVSGDVSLPRLGLACDDHAVLTDRVDLVINSAASVVFDEPLDSALLQNIRSVEHAAAFASACRAASLVHISTAYVAGRLARRFLEGPLEPDVSSSEIAAIEETIAAVTRQAEAENWSPRMIRMRLVEEGMARAKRLGWHDVYSYTKALGEMVLSRGRGRVPTAVIRPTIVESSLRDPAPGWLENLNVGDPLWVEFGRGRMVDFPLAVDAILDMVPVDFVANALLAVVPRLGQSGEISYFTVGSGAVNPLSGYWIHEHTHDYFTNNPMYDRRGRPILVRRLTFPTGEQFRERTGDDGGRSSTKKRLLYLADLYETYTNASCIFDTTNTQRLLDELHPADREDFGFDVRHIDWRAYIQQVHIPGLRRHVLREDAGARATVGNHG